MNKHDTSEMPGYIWDFGLNNYRPRQYKPIPKHRIKWQNKLLKSRPHYPLPKNIQVLDESRVTHKDVKGYWPVGNAIQIANLEATEADRQKLLKEFKPLKVNIQEPHARKLMRRALRWLTHNDVSKRRCPSHIALGVAALAKFQPDAFKLATLSGAGVTNEEA